MDYNKLLQTLSVILDNDKFYSKGLTLVYHLDETTHRLMNEDLYYRNHEGVDGFIPSEEFEVTLDGVTVKFMKENNLVK